MSNYQQAYPYGGTFGARDQSHPSYLVPPLVPTYPNQYDHGYGSHAPQEQGHATSTYNAYGYNNALPAFSTAAATPSVPPLPPYQGWSLPLPPYSGLSNEPRETGFTNGTQHNAPYYAAATHPSRSTGQASKNFEQNELSEGEFEDGGMNADTPPSAFVSANYARNAGVQYTNAAQPAVYPSMRNYNSLQSVPTAHELSLQDSHESQLQDSDSYSPCVSPKEDNTPYRERSAQHEGATTTIHNNEPINEAFGSLYNGLQSSAPIRLHSTTALSSHSGLGSTTLETTSRAAHRQSEYSSNGKSIAEEKKKALGAILNLWPYDVRFQTYIDEGFREDFVKRLFDDLRLPVHSKSDSRSQKHNNSHQSRQENIRGSPVQDNANYKIMTSVSNTQLQRVNPDIQNGSLGASKQSLQEGSVPQQLGTSDPTSGKLSPINDKERTIQAKMEALRKSREERAQKAAAQKNAKIVAPPAQVPQIKESKPADANEATSTIPAPLPSSPSDQKISSIVPTDLPTPAAKTQPSNPTIPGLFLSSTAASPAPSIMVDGAANTQFNPRKRPVAADFDEPVLQLPAVKRPFGQSRSEQPLVIDISEDDVDSDEDVAMDLESENNQDSPVQSVRSLHNPRVSVIPNFPSHSNLQTRTLSTPASSAPTTPPVSHVTSRSSIAGRPEDLQRKESEIELLKKKIAEAEARKKARQTSSGTRTPKPSETNDEGSMAADVNSTINVEASIAMQRLIGIANNQVNADTQRLLDVEAAELAKIEDIKKNEAERIRLRRLQIENELPVVENEYQQNQRRLEEMRVEMAQIEVNLQKYMEQKHKYTEEMARLGQEAENQLQQQKEKLQDLKKEEAESIAGPAMPSQQITESQQLSQMPTDVPNDGPLRRSSSPLEVPLTGVPVNALVPTPLHSAYPPPAEADQAVSAQLISAIDNDDHISELHSPETAIMTQDVKEYSADDQALEVDLQDAVRAEADLDVEADEVDMENSYAPDPTQLAPESPLASKNDPTDSPSQRRASFVTERDSDDYEPPEATPLIDFPLPKRNVNNQTAVAGDDSVEGAFLDAAIKTISDITSKEPAYEGDDGEVLPPQNGSTPYEVLNTFMGPHNSQDADAEQVSKMEASSSSYFTPYESPLRHFRAYRFHPDFQQQIPGGLRSLTYSHKIDPGVEFCRYELAGGICNDSTCDLLHFKDIGLPDDAILTALGSPEQFTGSRRDEFCAGLRGVLIDLRVRKIRDFDAIAAEILAYRKRFHGDASKVLPLEGVSI